MGNLALVSDTPFFPQSCVYNRSLARKKTRKGKGGSRPSSLRDIKKKTILLQYFPAQAFSKRKRKNPLLFSPFAFCNFTASRGKEGKENRRKKKEK